MSILLAKIPTFFRIQTKHRRTFQATKGTETFKYVNNLIITSFCCPGQLRKLVMSKRISLRTISELLWNYPSGFLHPRFGASRFQNFIRAMNYGKLNANPTVYSTTKGKKRSHSFQRPERWGGWAGFHESDSKVEFLGKAKANASKTERNVVSNAQQGSLNSSGGNVSGTQITKAEDDVREPFDSSEIFDLIKEIQDPEHPLTLEQLNVLEVGNIHVLDEGNRIQVFFTPTVPHCSMSTLIGLSIRVKLLRSLPPRFKVDIQVMPGTHSQEDQVNKQLNDKERVAAALENTYLLQAVNKCLVASQSE